ncbi:hypothetical protein [Methanocella conradii]|uniref:hypothetical protein n=1 Tax=Methanocella conradii TaxID=1175444 RepID=UPI0024B3729B|nr:hypothetical protein [Methanocella conradii]MDI6895827.1 hypothetical protein [Methanocella conradii]
MRLWHSYFIPLNAQAMAIDGPQDCGFLMTFSFSPGRTLAMTRSMPACFAMALAVFSLSPVSQ